jgi:Dyp-type peroxidase family
MGLLENPVLPTDDIQGDIAPGFRRKVDDKYAQHFLLLQVVDADQARAALRDLLPDVTKAKTVVIGKGDEPPDRSTNLGFTFAGLQALVPDIDLGGVFAAHEAFRLGLAERSRRKVAIEGEHEPFDLLGDPTGWKIGHGDGSVDVVINLGAPNATMLGRHLDDMLRRLGTGFKIVYEQPGALRDHPRQEPFGFADGLSQPRIRGLHKPPRPGIVAQPQPQLRPPNLFLVDEGNPITTDGSFMVWVRFRQHPDRFDQHCDEVAARLDRYGYKPATRDAAAAMEVGRWPDGTSLTKRQVTSALQVSNPSEAFNYTEDFYGRECPRHAHVRKMNPRNADADDVAILRRGIPFRQHTEAGVEEGLVFVCYQASIERQYEKLQAYWANAAYEPEENSSPDPMISQAARNGCTVEVPWPDGGSIPVPVHNDWIEPTGGFYAFVPSLPALHLLFD